MKATWLRRYNTHVDRIQVDVIDDEPDARGYVLVNAHFAYFDKHRWIRPENLVYWSEFDLDDAIPEYTGPRLITRIVE